MKGFARLVIISLTGAFAAVSCSKDTNDLGSLAFDVPAVYFSTPGETITVGFTSTDIVSVSLTGRPTGWGDIVLDAATRTVKITAPTEFKDGEVLKSGTVVLSGVPVEGSVKSASVFIAMVDTKDLSAKTANSYLVADKKTHYTFDATKRGDGSQIATAGVGVIWQHPSGLLEYVHLENGKTSFYVGADAKDEKIKEGNALIGAYAADGTLLWSWHVWATAYDSESDVLSYKNGYKVMGRNLGALNNANSTAEEKLASYGLYYQWGRKEPFVGPGSYQANNGTSASMYNAAGSRVYVTTAASSAETGTLDFAMRNPLAFITGTTESGNDWMWSHSTTLWGATKTVNDPCPYGWKVAPAEAFEGLQMVGTPTGDDYDKYGWTLGDGSASSLYMAAGRRVYTNGTIQNLYNPVLPTTAGARNVAQDAQPWVGYYWTTDVAAENTSSAFYFWYDKRVPADSGVTPALAQKRANGMQVRCVKVQ